MEGLPSVASTPDPEKRGTPRIQPFVARCRIECRGTSAGGYVTDLSERGAQVSCPVEALPDGAQSVVLEVRFSRQAALARLPARVQWTRPGRKPGQIVFGVTFEELDEPALGAVRSAVERFQRQAALLG